MKKYPITWMWIITVVCVFGGMAVWSYIDFFSGNREGWQSVFFPCFVGGTSLIFIVLLIISFTETKFGKKLGKLWKAEQKNREKKFKGKVRSDKEIILVVRRRLFASLSFLFGVILAYLYLVLLPYLLKPEMLFFVPVPIALIVFGLVFSVFFPKKFVTVVNGKFVLNHTNGEMIIDANEIKTIKTVIDADNKKARKDRELFNLLYSDVEVELCDGQKLLFKKADKVFKLGHKVKVIKTIFGE